MTKYLMWAMIFLLILDIAGTIGMYLAWRNEPIEREYYQMFKAVKIPEDTVYVDPITIGTTTDPTDEELKTK
jgi:hypothetical protein